MEHYYTLDDITKRRILGLIEKCKESELGNVSFDYYESPKHDAAPATGHLEKGQLS